MTAPTRTPWLLAHRGDPRARIRLLCFPYAGGGASMFSGWSAGLPAEIDVCAVQLPGRQTRLADPPVDRLPELVDAVEDGLAEFADLTWAVFGHSFGALVAYELARRRDRTDQPVRHLFVAASCAPQLLPKYPLLHALPEPELLAELDRLGSAPAGLAEHRELLELTLPTVRADLTACETYRPPDTTPLRCPITAFAATRDTRLSVADLAAWRDVTSAGFDLRTVPGGHFLLDDHRTELLTTVAQELAPWTT